jgi:histone deacetylase 1/2
MEYTVLPFSSGLILVSDWVQEDEDMDIRPKRQLWSGEDYDSDPDEDEKANIRSSSLTSHMR